MRSTGYRVKPANGVKMFGLMPDNVSRSLSEGFPYTVTDLMEASARNF